MAVSSSVKENGQRGGWGLRARAMGSGSGREEGGVRICFLWSIFIGAHSWIHFPKMKGVCDLPLV